MSKSPPPLEVFIDSIFKYTWLHCRFWLSHLALAIYMFVVVNFDALAQASDIRI